MASLLSSNTFDPSKDIPSLLGKTFIVTGGSAGIGFGIVAHLVKNNAKRVYQLSSKQDHAESAQEELKKFGDPSVVVWKQTNLQSLAETEKVANEIKSELESQNGGKLECLILNAGEGVGKYNQTVDGLDSHMQVNHFSRQ